MSDYYELGTYSRPVTTKSPQAQVWFDRGLLWYYGFNREESVRCFRRAAEHDPECAMAWWGIASASGSEYNKRWEEFAAEELREAVANAHRATEAALARMDGATPVEQALVRSLAQRYRSDQAVSLDELRAWNDAYAASMREVYAAFPDDPDVVALFAEAMLNRTPWQLWDLESGEPAPGADTPEAVAVLERAMGLTVERGDAPHLGVAHMYIHTMEMSPHPERALRACDALRGLATDAGHFLHMPSHIDVLCGDYHAALVANDRAIAADRKYLEREGPLNFYTLSRTHNYHFKLYSAMFLGQYGPALDAANELVATIPDELLRVTTPPTADWLEGFVGMKVHVLVRFGRWEEILDEPLPGDPELYRVTTAMLHYAKGVAHAARGRIDAAQAEQQRFAEAFARVPTTRKIFNNTCRDILAIAAAMLRGEIEYRKRDHSSAFERLRHAVTLADSLPYDEPWGWMQPVRHALGALLLEQGRVEEAAQVYRADLGLDGTLSRASQHPDNVWSLHGYVECLHRLGEHAEAASMQRRLDLAAARADVEIGASCFCRLAPPPPTVATIGGGSAPATSSFPLAALQGATRPSIVAATCTRSHEVRMRVGIIDLLGKEPPRSPYSRFMRANNTSVMTQVVAVWCEDQGHRVSIAYYSGWQLLAGGLPADLDVVFFNSFSQTALVAYAMSARFRAAGVVTVLGGAHARSYPEDARRYFDYVVGFCDEKLIRDILQDLSPSLPLGQCLSATRHPSDLPGLTRRWKFLLPAMERAPLLRLVPMIGSLGCPYTCSFCVDAEIAYQPLDTEVLKADLRFFQKHRLPRSIIVWHDPNFGVRFDDFLGAIEASVRPGSITFLAESSLSLLGEDHLKRLAQNGFKVIAPGIESWFGIGEKARLRKVWGAEKVRRVAEKVNLIQRYIPYVQCNLIFGLDCDEGPEPFELTKLFIDLAPGIFPYFSVLTCFGRNAADNLTYQRSGRVLPVPFHFLDLLQAMNVKPKHYGWPEFYDQLCGVFAHAFSARAIARRFLVTRTHSVRLEQLFRALSAERSNRLRYHREMRRWLDEPQMRAFFEGDTREIPERFTRIVQSHLGPLWHWLPPGALEHDPDAFVKSITGSNPSAWSGSPVMAGASDREPRPGTAIPDAGHRSVNRPHSTLP